MSLSQTLSHLKQQLQNAKTIVATAPGPLPAPERSTLATQLTEVKDDIATALIDINDEGTPDTTLPASLPDIAARCYDLAEDAVKTIDNDPTNIVTIGDDLKTIDYLIDAMYGYRDRAGIS